MGDDCRRRRPPIQAPAGEYGEDRISSLPDELLHSILLCLGSARAAARTSVLSRRWRRVWTYLPGLLLSGNEDLALSFPDTVDAALAAYAAPTLEHLIISRGAGVPARRVAPWLRFASQRVAGRLFIGVSSFITAFLVPVRAGEEAEELELPACGAATSISLVLQGSWRLRPTGVFSALTSLGIEFVRMEGRDISALVQTQCPLLEELVLIVTLVAVSDVSIHSDSLQSLRYCVRNTRRLEVVAPILENLSVLCCGTEESLISAPKLAKVSWCGDYDLLRHQFAHVRRRLCLLQTRLDPRTTLVMKQFDEVDELSLQIYITQVLQQYKETFNSIIEKSLLWPSLRYSCPSVCPCRLAESYKIDSIVLSSLEEVEINSFVGSHEEMEFVELLSRCNEAVLKKLVIICATDPAPELTKEICQKVRSMCRPNLKVVFYVISDGKRVHFN